MIYHLPPQGLVIGYIYPITEKSVGLCLLGVVVIPAMAACTSQPLPLTPPRQNALLDAPGDGVGPTQPHASPVMGNVFDDGGWLHLAAPQAEFHDHDVVLDDDKGSVAGEASDANNLCNGECIVFHFVGV